MGRLTTEGIARLFEVNLIDYERQSSGILLASGCGIMMAIMDQSPRFRWCVDLDEIRQHSSRIPNLLVALDLNAHVELIGIAGWFTIDKPEPFLEGVARCHRKPVASYLGGASGGSAATLREFLAQVN